MNSQTIMPAGRSDRLAPRFIIPVTVLVVLVLASRQTAAPAAPPPTDKPLIAEGVDASGQIRLTVNRSTIITTARPCKRVSVAQPEVADVNIVAPTSLLLTAKKGGATQVILWDEAERAQVVDVLVSLDMAALAEQVKLLLPACKIDVSSANGAIVLRGRVPSAAAAEQAVQLAQSYGKVLNFLELGGGQQIMLQVRFAEVSRSALSNLGVNGSFVDGAFLGGSNIGQVNPVGEFTRAGIGNTPPPAGLSALERTINPSVTLFGSGQIGSTYVDFFVNALRQNNLLRMLAEPNLVAISGQEASFLAGGSFPIPVTQGGGGGAGASITIEFREFGVKLVFVPAVLGDGRIRMRVAPEVSDLDFTTAVRFSGFVVPGLTQRKVNTTIELSEGQTFAIAGLLNNSVTATKDVTPVLGDLPILGALFRSVRYQRKETELLVLVTPRLAAALNPGQVPQLPGEKWRHPTENELFYNQDLGGPVPNASRRPSATQPAAGTAPRFYGAYGFVPVE
jgi:pilus assembly protein CpaC